MERINKTCPGDCSKCSLLESGEVEYMPCVIDQIFQRQQAILENQKTMLESINAIGKSVTDILSRLGNKPKIAKPWDGLDDEGE